MNVNEVSALPNSEKRIWSYAQVFWATVIGSFLAGFYLISENYKALNQLQLAKKTLITGVTSSFIIIGSIFFLPEEYEDQFTAFIILSQMIVAIFFLMMEHYKTFYNYETGLLSKLLLIVFALGILMFPLYSPFDIPAKFLKFSGRIMPAIALQGFVQSLQSEHIKNLTGHKKGSFWKLMGISLIGLFTFFAMIGVFILLDPETWSSS